MFARRGLTTISLGLLTLLGCGGHASSSDPAVDDTPTPPASEGGNQVEAPRPDAVEKPAVEDTQVEAMDESQRTTGAKAFAAANNQLSFDLLSLVGAEPTKNFAVSAASIELALGMTAAGAREETLAQMRKAMALAEGDDPAQLGQAVMAHWEAEASASLPRWGREGDPKPGVELQTANRLYGEASLRFEDPFIELTRAAFGAPLESVDFRSAAESVRTQINAWVAERTRDKIDDLLPAGSLDAETRLVLVNAIYFKGAWETAFKEERTADADFYVDGNAVKVPTMTQTEPYPHAREGEVEIVKLPYLGGRFSMMVVMPTGGQTLAQLQEGLDAKRWESWRSALKRERLQLFFPRFKVEPPRSIELKDALSKLGMPIAFDSDRANFLGIANPPDPLDRLYIAEVFHQAVVEVDEAGTEAAAATAVVMARGKGMPAPPAQLKIDRPFLFSIEDEATGGILFLGRVADPRG